MKNTRNISHDLFDEEPKEKGINSKKKGDTNERECARWLYKWTGVKFARTPSSGGLRWDNNSSVVGDVVCQDETFKVPLIFETKHLKSIKLLGNLRSNSKVFTVYSQCYADACRANKCPMLILRVNGMGKGKYIIYLPFELEGVKKVARGTTSEGTSICGYDSEDLVETNHEAVFVFARLWNKIEFNK